MPNRPNWSVTGPMPGIHYDLPEGEPMTSESHKRSLGTFETRAEAEAAREPWGTEGLTGIANYQSRLRRLRRYDLARSAGKSHWRAFLHAYRRRNS